MDDEDEEMQKPLCAKTKEEEEDTAEYLQELSKNRLMEIAVDLGIPTKGNMVNLRASIMEEIKNPGGSICAETLQEAVMQWNQVEQKKYLKDMNKSVSGTKPVLCKRILKYMPKSEMRNLIREYKLWLETEVEPQGLDDKDSMMDTTAETELTEEEERIAKMLRDKRIKEKKRSFRSDKEVTDSPEPPPQDCNRSNCR